MSLTEKIRAAAKVEISDSDLNKLVNYITALQLEQQEYEKMELSLKMRKDYIRKLEEQTIPEHMDSLGMEEFTTTSGVKVKVKSFFGGNIKEENREAAFAWLRENNKGAIIKTAISMTFGMGEEEKAAEVQENLVESCIPFTAKESVHPATLISFVKESLEGGIPLPDIFGAFTGKKVTIKNKKDTE